MSHWITRLKQNKQHWHQWHISIVLHLIKARPKTSHVLPTSLYEVYFVKKEGEGEREKENINTYLKNVENQFHFKGQTTLTSQYNTIKLWDLFSVDDSRMSLRNN